MHTSVGSNCSMDITMNAHLVFDLSWVRNNGASTFAYFRPTNTNREHAQSRHPMCVTNALPPKLTTPVLVRLVKWYKWWAPDWRNTFICGRERFGADHRLSHKPIRGSKSITWGFCKSLPEACKNHCIFWLFAARAYGYKMGKLRVHHWSCGGWTWSLIGVLWPTRRGKMTWKGGSDINYCNRISLFAGTVQ